MIDTISIMLNVERYAEDDSQLHPEIKQISININNASDNQTVYHKEILFDWSEELKATGEYLPDVRYLEYPNPDSDDDEGLCYVCKVTASLPKLLYGNNILEVSEGQFEEIVELLHSKLILLAPLSQISKERIKGAKVVRVDFGKNILIPGSVSTRQISDMLKRSEHRLDAKNAQVQYREGELYREYIKARSVVMYDKLAEFCANNPFPSSDIEKFFITASKIKMFQVIRLEAQIQNTRQLKAELKSLKLSPRKTTFEDVFSEDLAKRLLSKCWYNMTKHLDTGTKENEDLLDIFIGAAEEQPKCRPQKAYAKVGFAALANEVGLDIVKRTFCDYYDSGSWARCRKNLYHEAKEVGALTTIEDIAEAIEEMKPIGIWEEGEDVQF